MKKHGDSTLKYGDSCRIIKAVNRIGGKTMHKDIWTDRQSMPEADSFEFHHYLDEIALQVESHQHSFYELFFFLSGNVNYTIEGKTYKLRPGDILLTNPHDVHSPEILPGKPYERIVIWISEDFFDHLPAQGKDLSACFLDASTRDYRLLRPEESQLIRLKKLCGRISAAKEDDRFGSLTLQYSCLLAFLVEVGRCYYDLRELPMEDIAESGLINEIIRYLNEHITEELCLDAIAGHFFTSKFHLSKSFRKFTGISIYQYIMKKRLTIARDLIRGGIPVTTACLDCGFGDYSNFLKAFKREYGKTPKEYAHHPG